MKLTPYIAVCALAATPAFAQETRQLDAHEHGVGTLDIAFDGPQVAMTFTAPGADIVGFEYEATRDEDLAAIETALATLNQPLELFTLPDAAGCSVVEAVAELETEESHDDQDDHGDEGHEDHADEGHDDHGHDDHGDEGHDDHADHADEAAGHTEFHADYMLTCDDPTAVTSITFAYFEAFPNALEVEVQLVTDSGATAFEVERDAPVLDLSDVF